MRFRYLFIANKSKLQIHFWCKCLVSSWGSTAPSVLRVFFRHRFFLQTQMVEFISSLFLALLHFSSTTGISTSYPSPHRRFSHIFYTSQNAGIFTKLSCVFYHMLPIDRDKAGVASRNIWFVWILRPWSVDLIWSEWRH